MQSKTFQVSIFGTAAVGIDMGDDAAFYFTKHLRQPVRMLYIGGAGRREIPGASYLPFRSLSIFAKEQMHPQRIRFADAAPLLVTSTASEDDARSRLPRIHRNEDVILRLRPNIHIDVQGEVPAYDEDYWKTLRIHSGPQGSEEIIVKCIFKCVRCLSLNVDMEKGSMIATNRQLYGLLASDRRVNEAAPRKSQRSIQESKYANALQTSQSSANTHAPVQVVLFYELAMKLRLLNGHDRVRRYNYVNTRSAMLKISGCGVDARHMSNWLLAAYRKVQLRKAATHK